MDIEEGRKKWQALYDEWQPINQEACQARNQCTIKFIEGKGGPTAAELDAANALERKAMELRTAMDNVSKQVFGD